MNIEHMTPLEKSAAAARLVSEWKVRQGQGTFSVYEKIGNRHLFTLTEANNFYETGAVNSPGLYDKALPIINPQEALSAGPLSEIVPAALDLILGYAEVEDES